MCYVCFHHRPRVLLLFLVSFLSWRSVLSRGSEPINSACELAIPFHGDECDVTNVVLWLHLEIEYQEKIRQQRKDLGLFQALVTAHCKSPLFGQTAGRRERFELDWVILGVPWVGDEGCGDDCSLQGLLLWKRRQSAYLCLSWVMFSVCCKSCTLFCYSVLE